MRKEIPLLKKREAIRANLLKDLPKITPAERYDLEYLFRSELNASLYYFDSPIFDLLKDLLKKLKKKDLIVDIGTGNGQLLRSIKDSGFKNLFGIDIAHQSIKMLSQFKINGFCGRVENSLLENSSTDLLFLSYFVDRDNDQQKTFESSVQLLKPRGTLVLEGLFPCILQDSNGINYGPANVTKGMNRIEDIFKVTSFFERIGLKLLRISCEKRVVFSLDGFETLPSDILIFQKK